MCSCVTSGYCRTDPCESPFSQLGQLFGEEAEDLRGWTASHSRYLPECDVRASLCFKKYLNLNPRTPRPLDAQSLEAKVLRDSEAWRLDPLLVSFRQDFHWLDGHENTFTRKDLMKILMTYAMGTDDDPPDRFRDALTSPNSYTWSFCKDKWVPRHRTVHCKYCDVCYDLAWHRKDCATCKAGRGLACDGCGGWSEDGVWNGEDGPKAPDAHKAQRGLSQVSPRKRARSLEIWNDAVSEVSGSASRLQPACKSNSLTFNPSDCAPGPHRYCSSLVRLQRCV